MRRDPQVASFRPCAREPSSPAQGTGSIMLVILIAAKARHCTAIRPMNIRDIGTLQEKTTVSFWTNRID